MPCLITIFKSTYSQFCSQDNKGIVMSACSLSILDIKEWEQ